MAFAVTSQLDAARLSDGELASAAAAAQHIAETCLADGPVGRVGLEIEAHCFDLAEPHRRPTWDEITEVIEVAAGHAGRQRDHRRARRRGRAVRSAR